MFFFLQISPCLAYEYHVPSASFRNVLSPRTQIFSQSVPVVQLTSHHPLGFTSLLSRGKESKLSLMFWLSISSNIFTSLLSSSPPTERTAKRKYPNTNILLLSCTKDASQHQTKVVIQVIKMLTHTHTWVLWQL